MKITKIIMVLSFLVAIVMIGKAFVLNEDSTLFLLIFFAVGSGLGLLRLFVNSSIKKMKGKGWTTKVLFFGVLLGLGLPFQSWFRKSVLLSIDSSFLMSSIILIVLGILFMTTCYNIISHKIKQRSLTN